MRCKLKIVVFTVLISSLLLLNAAGANTLPKNASFCPAISALKKHEASGRWFADGRRWRSYDPSFAEKISAFLGAQWRGNNLGNLTCLYQPQNKENFIVQMRYSHLIFTPKGGAWTKDLGGYKNCRSQDQKDCYYILPKKPTPTNIYKEAEGLEHAPKQQPGF